MRIVLVALAIVVLPYLYSRIVSPWNQVTTYAGDPLTQEPQSTLRIACFNIAHGRGQSESNWTGESEETRLARLDAIAQLIKSLNVDLVVLNEVDFQTSWSHSVNQAKYLAEAAGYPYRVEERNLDFRILFRTWRFGNAILSRYPIEDARVIDLPSYSNLEATFAGKKRAVECVVDFQGNKVDIAAVHLSHRSEAIRAQSVPLLMPAAHPKLVAGDFNSTPSDFPHSARDLQGSNAIDTLDASGNFQRHPLVTPEDESQLTFPSANPNCVIDWILATHDWEIVDYEVIPSLLSDHRPVVLEVRLRTEK